jgi:hypothetical protein
LTYNPAQAFHTHREPTAGSHPNPQLPSTGSHTHTASHTHRNHHHTKRKRDREGKRESIRLNLTPKTPKKLDTTLENLTLLSQYFSGVLGVLGVVEEIGGGGWKSWREE